MYTGGSGLCPELSLSFLCLFTCLSPPCSAGFRGVGVKVLKSMVDSLIYCFLWFLSSHSSPRFYVLSLFRFWKLPQTSPTSSLMKSAHMVFLLHWTSHPCLGLCSLPITPHVFIAILYLIISGTLSAVTGTGLFRVWAPSYAWLLHLSKDVRTSLRLFPARPAYLSPPAGWGPWPSGWHRHIVIPPHLTSAWALSFSTMVPIR